MNPAKRSDCSAKMATVSYKRVGAAPEMVSKMEFDVSRKKAIGTGTHCFLGGPQPNASDSPGRLLLAGGRFSLSTGIR